MASEDYRTREEATKALRKLIRESHKTRDELVACLHKQSEESQDPEVCQRVRAVLDQYLRPWKYLQKLQTLSAHSKPVYSIAFSPDGKLLVSASEDETVRIWDIAAGKCTRSVSAHKGGAYSAVFSPDGGLIASAGADKAVNVWNACTGICLQTLRCKNEMRSVTFSPDGKLLASCGGFNEGIVHIWDTTTWECVKTITGHEEAACCVVFSPDGKTLASSDDYDQVKIWDVETGKCIRTLEGDAISHREATIYNIRFSPDGGLLGAACEDGLVLLWNWRTGKRCHKFGEYNPIDAGSPSLAFCPRSRILAAGCPDKNIRVWDTTTGKCLRTLIPFAGEEYPPMVLSLDFSPDGRFLAAGIGCSTGRTAINHGSGSKTNCIIIWGIPEDEEEEKKE
jgi:WD40 repeat protein